MTAPARPTAQVQVQAPPQDDQLVQQIAEVLLAAYAAKLTLHALIELLTPYGLMAEAVQAAVGLAGSGTADVPNARLDGLRRSSRGGKLVRKVAANDLYFRAAYIMNAARRITESVKEGNSIRVALSEESPYYRQHEQARKGRIDAARQVGKSAELFGPLLGWYLNPLLNNEAECIAANGHNFYAEQGTLIGLPGSVHPKCGCKAGPPIDGAGMVDDAVRPVINQIGSRTKLVKLRPRKAA